MIRNSALNLIGGIAPAFVAIVCTPLILNTRGAEFFATYALQTAMLMAFGLLDFGISRGVMLTTFDRVANPSGSAAQPFRTGLRLSLWVAAAMVGVGVPVAWVSLGGASPAGLDLGLSTAIHVAASAATILTLPSRAVLEIHGKFGRLNAIRGSLACIVPLAPLIPTADAGFLYTQVALVVFGSRALAVYAYHSHLSWSSEERALPNIADKAWVRAFMKRCGWVGLTNGASLILTYADRFVLASLGTATQVAHFTVAHEAATKAWLVNGAVQSASAPKIANEARSGAMNSRGAVVTTKRLLLAVVLLPIATLILVSDHVFQLWLGASYDPEIAAAARVLLAGIAVNSMSQVNFGLLQIHRGEHLGAYLQGVNVVLAVLLMAGLIPLFGVVGAAAAFTIRLAIDAFITRFLTVRTAGSKAGVNYLDLALATIGFSVLIFICWNKS